MQIVSKGEFVHIIKRSGGMLAEAKVFADADILAAAKADGSLQQLINCSYLPGVSGEAIAMPDIHYGYGLPIGSVIATKLPEGAISPAAVGYDIGCGVRMSVIDVQKDYAVRHIDRLVKALYKNISVGAERGGGIKLSSKDFNNILMNGAHEVINIGFGEPSDMDGMERCGEKEDADIRCLSSEAIRRGITQMGTLGAGNHFLEISYVDEIYDEAIANSWGITDGLLTLMVHSGSRGFGHQVCSDYLKIFKGATSKLDRNMNKMKDKDLIYAPYSSSEAQNYIRAASAAVNFAAANRQVLMDRSREVLKDIFTDDINHRLLYDLSHNTVRKERHTINAIESEFAVHRKGAIRAYPPDAEDLHTKYSATGHPLIIPGDMGRYSYVLSSVRNDSSLSFHSVCHGAGRALSRSSASKNSHGRNIAKELAEKGVMAMAPSKKSLGEEMPEAYKDVAQVVNIVHNAGLANLVFRVRPLGIIKG